MCVNYYISNSQLALTITGKATLILTPTEEPPMRTLLVYLGMILFLPVFMDCILAFRLYAVYPPKATPKAQLAIIFIPIILFKVARTVNLIVFMAGFGVALLKPGSPVIYFQIVSWGSAPWTNLKVEWILQVFDNWYVFQVGLLGPAVNHSVHSYASGLFLWKLWLGQKRMKNSGAVSSPGKLNSSCVW